MARKAISEEFWTWEKVGIALGAISAGAAGQQATVIDGSRLQGCRASMFRYHSEWLGKTAAQGPIQWGLSWGITATEVAECMTADPQFDIEEDMVEVRRNLINIGIIPRSSTVSPASVPDISYGYRKIRLPSWDVLEGSSIQIWHFVPANGVTLTSGTIHHLTWGFKQGWLDA